MKAGVKGPAGPQRKASSRCSVHTGEDSPLFGCPVGNREGGKPRLRSHAAARLPVCLSGPQSKTKPNQKSALADSEATEEAWGTRSGLSLPLLFL